MKVPMLSGIKDWTKKHIRRELDKAFRYKLLIFLDEHAGYSLLGLPHNFGRQQFAIMEKGLAVWRNNMGEMNRLPGNVALMLRQKFKDVRWLLV
jgi:hypothetical protein